MTGTFVAEIGVGIVHHAEPAPPRVVDPAVVELHRRMKERFDPTGTAEPRRRRPLSAVPAAALRRRAAGSATSSPRVAARAAATGASRPGAAARRHERHLHRR